MTELVLTLHGNVQLYFENGIAVSANIGIGSYSHSTGRDRGFRSDVSERIKSSDLEIGIWRGPGNADREWLTHHFIDTGGDQVAGYVPVDDLLDIVARARAMTSDEVATLKPHGWGPYE